MTSQEFLRALLDINESFFIWNDRIRTRARANKESTDPITAVANAEGYKGDDLDQAIRFLNLDFIFAVKVTDICNGDPVYTPEDLKLKAKIVNRTIKRSNS